MTGKKEKPAIEDTFKCRKSFEGLRMSGLEIGSFGNYQVVLDLEKAEKIVNQQLLEENMKFRKVLEFYANRRNFDFKNEKELRFCNSDDQEEVFQPFGTKAKEILKEFKR